MVDKIKLFCFPYAGGSSTVYARWRRYLNENIELCPVELPGRGSRMAERLKDSMEEIVNDAYSSIEKKLDCPFAFFGHSMGSIIAYELCLKLFNQKELKPVHAFFSGRRAPHLDRQEEIIHKLPDDVFKERIIALGGTPVEILEYPELLDIFLPILRADYKAVETYAFKHNDADLGCDISILNGKQDDITFFEIAEWNRHTSQNCKIHMFEGRHFYINECYADVIVIINHVLGKCK